MINGTNQLNNSLPVQAISNNNNIYRESNLGINNNSNNYNNYTNRTQEELLEKLNIILHLLEEQQEEPSSMIIEELILYVFLGIFIIYVLDSFVKIGKYKR